ncbi:MAG: phosphoadenylyl-sulfate reductase [Prochlorococcaceae cyanobacterium]
MPTAVPTSLPCDCLGRPIDLEAARNLLAGLEAPGRLRWAYETFGPGLVLTTSFGIQSAVSLHMLSQLSCEIPVLWVDTGYLPPETYRYAADLSERLSLNLRVVQAEISPARMEALHGRLWESGDGADLDLYHRIRKVEPLDRALEQGQVRCWASGVRGGQTDHRRTMQPLEAVRNRWSLRPLLSWTNRDVYYYMEEHQLPQHPLFEQGYSSVGDWHSSAPDSSDLQGRATRFSGLKQECGIHLSGMEGEGI